MKIPEHLLSVDEVAEIFQVDRSTIYRYEDQGILRRVPKIPKPLFNPKQISELIGLDLESFNPFLLKKAQAEVIELRQQVEALQGKLDQIKKLI